MKLYLLNRNTKFKFEDKVFTFDRIDGMYARVYNSNNELELIACYAEVEECL